MPRGWSCMLSIARLVNALVAHLDRRVAFSLSITDRELYLSIGHENLAGKVVRLTRNG